MGIDKTLTKLWTKPKWLTKNVNCSIKGCDKNIYAAKFCSMHYQRARFLSKDGVTSDNNWAMWFASMHKPQRMSRVTVDGDFKECSIYKCVSSVYAKGLCHKHYVDNRKKKTIVKGK